MPLASRNSRAPSASTPTIRTSRYRAASRKRMGVEAPEATLPGARSGSCAGGGREGKPEVEPVQDRCEKLAAVLPAPGRQQHRGGGAAEGDEIIRLLIDVQPAANQGVAARRAAVALGQHTGELGVAGQEVVRPLDRRRTRPGPRSPRPAPPRRAWSAAAAVQRHGAGA